MLAINQQKNWQAAHTLVCGSVTSFKRARGRPTQALAGRQPKNCGRPTLNKKWRAPDRFFDPATGVITTEYKEAAREANLKVFQADDASIQPGQANLGQLLLHETGVSWVRYRLARTLPAKAWEESVDEFGTRLRSIANDINSQLNVEGLCKEFPSRVEAVLEQGGDNIAK